MKGKTKCACGCGVLIDAIDVRGRPRLYSRGHTFKGRNRPNPSGVKSKSSRTGRWRANQAMKNKPFVCELKRIGGCGLTGKLTVHHKDKDTMNNAPSNLARLCYAHHFLVEHGKIDLDNPVMPEFTVSSGKRRYK